MADIVAEGSFGATSQEGQPSDQMTDQDRHSWRLAKAFIEGARGYSVQKTSNFNEDYRFFLGENHYPIPENYRAILQYGWRNRGIRNWLFATIDHKMAVVLDAEPKIHVAGLNDDISFVDRYRISSAIGHELRRLRWEELMEDCFLDGAVTGKGIVHVRMEYDKVSQRYALVAEGVDPTSFHPDPTASRLSACRFIVWDPIMDMSDIRAAFPDRAKLVVADAATPIGSLGPGSGFTRSDQDLVQGTSAGEFAFGRDGSIMARRARVSWVWIKDETVVSDIEEKVIKEASSGYQCVGCGSQFESSEAVPVPGDTGGPTPTCPDCGSQALNQITLPEVSQSVAGAPTKLYPFGRLIVICGEVLLYDGPNPHNVENVFPFVEYNHYRVPRRYWGYGDVALLRSSQSVANRIVAMGIDYMRLAGNGPFEYPSDAEAYTNLGAAPGQLVPVASHLVGLARWVHPEGYDVRMHEVLDAIVLQDFQRVGGVTDVSTGVSPAAPTSGVEVRARQAAASTRLGQHLKRLNQTRSDLALISWQMMVQNYIEDRTFMAQDFMGQAEGIKMNVSALPASLAVEVTASPDDIQKDALMGQNLAGLIQTGALFAPEMQPFLDIFLVAMGMDWSTAKEMQQRIMALQEQQAAQQEAAMAGAGAAQPGSQGSPLTGQGPAGAPQVQHRPGADSYPQ